MDGLLKVAVVVLETECKSAGFIPANFAAISFCPETRHLPQRLAQILQSITISRAAAYQGCA
jgi:hypothetical protein